MEVEAERLTEFFKAVRQSSLKRFRKVKSGDGGWRPRSDILSFVDTLKHLIDSDHWMFEYLENGRGPEGTVISPGDARAEDWARLLTEFENSGRQVAEFIGGLSDSDFSNPIQEPKGSGNSTWWWIIVRGNIDHEIHHRGQLQVLLRLRYED